MTLIPANSLRRFTTARVGLGRAGTSLPTAAHLDFQEAHAAARDAVWSALDPVALGLEAPVVQSEARDRREYLLRPDLGRRLREADRARLPRTGGVVVVVADGLCATGVQSQAAALLRALGADWPVVVALQARVALGDDIAHAMGAAAVVVMIGERPGLSAQDSVGLYLTWAPRPGRTDAERNCISNIRPGGLSHADAAAKLHWLLRGARALGASGVALKDDMPAQNRLAP
ncbi:ethanolamine ammonia-lyase subunit EutC [Roseococcus suduntuyensis]|uniref:Ethanolamine ammonia-lyase small subunit n=1 Tax=Roseococcus suduntuyensis TaxID=455361 RepID=A0A840ABS9_9PROT|nr:ethanolamine ammonia-lyase subunit EutC [Roseococcus suduntuyensis]MBB3897595.1 ethanolamine ammonia-lyase small subunit [Roseococcus suduntuyensis]